MDGGSDEGSEARFATYVEALGAVLGHADRRQPMHDYWLGLLMPIERKSVEPMAAVTAPAQVAAKHQSLLHFVGNAAWSDTAMLAKVGELVLPAIERGGPIEAWIIDDMGFAKKGRRSVGVTRQYCGQLGKQDNCQIAVTLSLINHDASLPIAYRLYLSEDWAKARRRKAKVRETIAFQTKPQIALEQIEAARAAGLPQGVVLMDAGYGNDTTLRTQITALDMRYVAGIGPSTSVWVSGTGPLPAPLGKGIGRPPAATRRAASAELGQGARCRPAGRSLANHHVARGYRGRALLAVCTAARAAGASRYLAERAARRRMAGDRVAGRGSRADQVLARHSARGHHLRAVD